MLFLFSYVAMASKGDRTYKSQVSAPNLNDIGGWERTQTPPMSNSIALGDLEVVIAAQD